MQTQPRLEAVDPAELPRLSNKTDLRVVLAHDWLVGYRGGEAVLDAIARALAPRCTIVGLLTMFDDGRPLTPAIDAIPKHASFLNRLPARNAMRRWLLPLYPRAVDSLSRTLAAIHAREPIDLLVSTSSAAIKGLRPPPGVPHICYCHSPARYLWSQTDEYALGRVGPLRSLGLKLFGPRLRAWDRASAGNVHQFIANSTHTAALITSAYGRPAKVLFPPVRTEFFTPHPNAVPRRNWLFVGALEPYKRVDLAIAAARLANVDLTIIGDGSMRADVERACAERTSSSATIRYLGRVSDVDLREAYRTHQALLFPQVEDFGIVAVEALACGLPVVARRAGGALDFVIDDQTGRFIRETASATSPQDTPPPPTPAWIVDAAQAASLIQRPEMCRTFAERFSPHVFECGFLEIVGQTLAAHHRGELTR